MFTITYPRSRIKSSGQCSMCRAFPGDFEERGLITLQMANGKEIKLLQWTCNYCGYTMFFDPTVTNTAPYRSEGTEEIPDFVKKYSS